MAAAKSKSSDAGAPDQKSTRSAKKAASRQAGTPGPWTFPRNSIEEAIAIPRALDEKFAGKEADADKLVKAVGLHKADDWRFQYLLHSSSLYGFTSGTGAKA